MKRITLILFCVCLTLVSSMVYAGDGFYNTWTQTVMYSGGPDPPTYYGVYAGINDFYIDAGSRCNGTFNLSIRRNDIILDEITGNITGSNNLDYGIPFTVDYVYLNYDGGIEYYGSCPTDAVYSSNFQIEFLNCYGYLCDPLCTYDYHNYTRNVTVLLNCSEEYSIYPTTTILTTTTTAATTTITPTSTVETTITIPSTTATTSPDGLPSEFGVNPTYPGVGYGTIPALNGSSIPSTGPGLGNTTGFGPLILGVQVADFFKWLASGIVLSCLLFSAYNLPIGTGLSAIVYDFFVFVLPWIDNSPLSLILVINFFGVISFFVGRKSK